MSAADVVQAYCPHCDHWFEDLEAAVEQHGGWCPRCDRPIDRP